jgi:UDP:flavonoid glycosyltransferase YjiC (YdhE family)
MVVTWGSAAMVNVVLNKKPLIVTGVFNEQVYHCLYQIRAIGDSNAAQEVTTTDELNKAISAILTDDKLRRFLEKSQETFCSEHLGLNDGKSVERIAEAIPEITARESLAN